MQKWYKQISHGISLQFLTFFIKSHKISQNLPESRLALKVERIQEKSQRVTLCLILFLVTHILMVWRSTHVLAMRTQSDCSNIGSLVLNGLTYDNDLFFDLRRFTSYWRKLKQNSQRFVHLS